MENGISESEKVLGSSRFSKKWIHLLRKKEKKDYFVEEQLKGGVKMEEWNEGEEMVGSDLDSRGEGCSGEF